MGILVEGLFYNLKEGLTLVTGSRIKATQHSYSPGHALNFLVFEGLKEGMTFNLWVITAGSIPPMSSLFQVKTSTFFFKKRMRRSLMSSANLDLMQARCSGWSSSYTGSSSS